MAAIPSASRFAAIGKPAAPRPSGIGRLRRAVNAFLAAREARANEEIAVIVARRGGCMGREAYAPPIPSRPSDPFGHQRRVR